MVSVYRGPCSATTERRRSIARLSELKPERRRRRQSMPLPFIAPAELSTEQRHIYEEMHAGIERGLQGFKSIAENGAVMGPWNPRLHEPKFSKPVWELRAR